MSTNDNGYQEPQTPDEDKTKENDEVEVSEEELESLDEETKKRFQTLDAQRKHYREKAIDPETGKTFKELWEEAQRANKPEPTPKPKLQAKATKEPEDDDLTARLSNLEMSEKKRQFGHEHGLSPDETDKIFQINPNPNEETLKDPFVKAGLDALRRSKRVEENTPSSSAKSSFVSSKKFKDLSPAEKQAEWENLMKKKGVIK